MSKRYDLVVFDWEGTLSDTVGVVLHCVADEARKLHFGELDENLARQCAELGLVKAIKKVFPALSLNEQSILLDNVQHTLLLRHNDVYLMPGALDIVRRLRDNGTKLAIASNKGKQSLQRAVSTTGLDEFFKMVRSAGEFPPKPSPDMLEDILFECSLQPSAALMVGDSLIDIDMARSIGMDAVGMNFYHKDPEELLTAGALKVFDNYDELAEFLQLPLEREIS